MNAFKGARVLALVALAIAAGSSHAAGMDGQARAQAACAVCHGPQGISSQPNIPHLAGQPKPYLMEQLRNYRSGRRQHEIMSVVSKPLSDQDIDALSEWYASLVISVRER